MSAAKKDQPIALVVGNAPIPSRNHRSASVVSLQGGIGRTEWKELRIRNFVPAERRGNSCRFPSLRGLLSGRGKHRKNACNKDHGRSGNSAYMRSSQDSHLLGTEAGFLASATLRETHPARECGTLSRDRSYASNPSKEIEPRCSVKRTGNPCSQFSCNGPRPRPFLECRRPFLHTVWTNTGCPRRGPNSISAAAAVLYHPDNLSEPQNSSTIRSLFRIATA